MDPLALLRSAFGPLVQGPGMLANAQIIVREFAAAGQPLGLTLAAIVNAYAESRLDNLVAYGRTPWGADRAAGPRLGGEDSVGLFMLNARGAGAGMSVASRQDPVQNTRRILQVLAGPAGSRLRSAAAEGASVATLTAIFTTDIERPANAVVEGANRAALARRLFPAIADAPGFALTVVSAPMTAASAVPWWAWGLSGLAVVTGVLLLWRRR